MTHTPNHDTPPAGASPAAPDRQPNGSLRTQAVMVFLDNPWSCLLLIAMLPLGLRTMLMLDGVAFLVTLGLFGLWCTVCGIGFEVRKLTRR